MVAGSYLALPPQPDHTMHDFDTPDPKPLAFDPERIAAALGWRETDEAFALLSSWLIRAFEDEGRIRATCCTMPPAQLRRELHAWSVRARFELEDLFDTATADRILEVLAPAGLDPTSDGTAIAG